MTLAKLLGLPEKKEPVETLAEGDDPRSYPGGGIDGVNVRDEVDVSDHETGSDDGVTPDQVDIDYNDEYGYPGTVAYPREDVHGVKETRDDMADFARSTWRGSVQVREQAGWGREDSVKLNRTMAPYLAAGADWARRSVILCAHPDNTTDVYVSVESGSFPSDMSIAPTRGMSVLSPGQVRVIRHTESLFLKTYGDTDAVTNIVSISIERYEK